MTQLQNLNYLLQNRDISYIIENNLTSEFFSDYKAEFDFIKTHYDEYGVIPDQLTFLAKFPTFDIVEVNETRAYLIDSLYEDLNKRKLAKIFNSIRKLLNEGKTDEALNLYISNSSEAIKSSKLESIDIFKDTTRYDEFIERGKDPTNFYVSTGFKELDELTGGWDRNEEIATIVARTGVGKTWCMLKTAIAAAESGLKVGIFSGEMSVSSVAYRVDTLISHISNGAIIHGNQVVKDEYAHYINNLSDRFMGTIRVMTPDMVNGKSGVTALRAFIEKEKLDMLCIDQHSLLEDDRNARNPVESASNISKDLKRLQVMKRIPIIAVSQQNRTQMGNGEVDSMQIAASDRIGQDSSTVVFITKTDDILTLNLVKARNSVSGKKISYSCDINRGIFQYIPEENNALDGAGSEELRQEYECNNEEREVF